VSHQTRVSVVVVSYQVRDLLRRCLVSVQAQGEVVAEIWVVDNASSDGSADLVAREFPAVRLIRNAVNVGFARANNQALAQASGAVLLLLNPDTELPAGGLAALVEIFARHPRAGAAGLALHNLDGSPQRSCHAFPGVFNMALEAIGLHRVALRFGVGTPYEAPVPRGGEGPVDWVAGACFAFTRHAHERVGGLDGEIFMYGEEMDWSWRARRLGLETVFSTAASALHHGEASGEGRRGELYVLNASARVRFLRLHRGAWRAALARELIALGSLLRLLYWLPCAALESWRGGVQPKTRDQVERFRAVVAWRCGRRA
jgi:GT2 family glycosyltransferase